MNKIAKVFSRYFTKYEEAEAWLNLLSTSYEKDEYKFIQHDIHEEQNYQLTASYGAGLPTKYKAIFRYG